MIRESLIAFDADTTSIDFKRTSSTAGGFLNYDTQVKIGFEGAPTPDHGFDPLPIPKYFVAGLAARLDNNSRFLGVSFLRGSNATEPLPDNIFDEIVPLDQKPLIVLWHQTNDVATRTWLAYKELTPAVFFSDDMESGESQWNKGKYELSLKLQIKPYLVKEFAIVDEKGEPVEFKSGGSMLGESLTQTFNLDKPWPKKVRIKVTIHDNVVEHKIPFKVENINLMAL